MEVPRGYRSTVRAEQAGLTHATVRSTASRLFAGQGYAATSMRQIATEAGVSLTTVCTVGTKADVFLLVLDEALNGVSDGSTLFAGARGARVSGARSLETALEQAARSIVDADVRITGLWAAFEEGSNTDADLERAYARKAEEMRDEARSMILAVAGAGLCRVPEDLVTTSDLCWAAAHPQHYALLVHHAGWSPDRFRGWLVQRFAELLG